MVKGLFLEQVEFHGRGTEEPKGSRAAGKFTCNSANSAYSNGLAIGFSSRHFCSWQLTFLSSVFFGLVHLPAPIPAADDRFMRLALREAAQGVGRTSPNPAVGAVIVRGGRVLARGYHHARRAAARGNRGPARAARRPAQARARRSTSRWSHARPTAAPRLARTPSWRAGLARVVIGATDPNPRHAGRADGVAGSARRRA